MLPIINFNINTSVFYLGTDRTLSYPSNIYNIPCNDTLYSNDSFITAQLHGEVIGFVTLAMKDVQTGELLLNYPVGVIRQRGQVKDDVSS